MWAPHLSQPVINILTHQGPIINIATDPTGYHLLTTGEDFQVKIWDTRNLQILRHHSSKNTLVCSDISQNSMFALGFENSIQIWKGAVTEKSQTSYSNRSFMHGLL